MNNAFCYSRDKEIEIYDRFPRRLSGSCLTVLRHLVIEAAYASGFYEGVWLERGEICISGNAIHLKTGLSTKTIRNVLNVLEKLNETGKQGANQGANKPTVYLIVNYEVWDALSKKGQTELKKRGKEGANRTEKGQTDFIGEIEEKGKPLKEVKEVKESTEQKHSPNGATKFVDKVAGYYCELYPTNKPPYSLFNKWRRNAADEKCKGDTDIAEKVILTILSDIDMKKLPKNFKEEAHVIGYIVDMLKIKWDETAAQFMPSRRLYADPEQVRQTDHLGNPIQPKATHA